MVHEKKNRQNKIKPLKLTEEVRLVVVVGWQHPRSTLWAVACKAGVGTQSFWLWGPCPSPFVILACWVPHVIVGYWCQLAPFVVVVGACCHVVLVLVWFVVVACWVLVLVWCRLLLPTNTHNPPCEQLLTGLVVGAKLSVGGVGDSCGAGHCSPHSWSPIICGPPFPLFVVIPQSVLPLSVSCQSLSSHHPPCEQGLTAVA
jgi:hypothetical protein